MHNAQGLYSFLVPKIMAKFDRNHPLRMGTPNAGSIGQNQPLSTNNSL